MTQVISDSVKERLRQQLDKKMKKTKPKIAKKKPKQPKGKK
jgi:hypothetical protein